jgi:hypothetical protein
VGAVHRTRAFAALGLVLAVVPPASSAAAKPPSFARWVAHWTAQSQKLIDAAVAPCLKVSDDLKNGECVVRREIPMEQKAIPEWERQVAAIARGQTKPCRAAIHRYWLAYKTANAAALIYFKSHRHTAVGRLDKDLKDEPYATLQSVSIKAVTRAVRVCG